MKNVSTTFFVLLTAIVAIGLIACDDDTPAFAAPCAPALPLTTLPDSCFDLPSYPTGESYTSPPFLDYRYSVLSASSTEDGVFYYLRQNDRVTNSTSWGDQKIFKHNICTGETTLVFEIIGGSNSTNFSVNGEGEILFQSRPSRPIMLVSAAIQIPVELLPSGEYIRTKWINSERFTISRWIGGSNFEPLIIDRSGNELALLPSILKGNTFDYSDGKYIIFFNAGSVNQGYLGKYDEATGELMLIEDISTNYGFNDMNMCWLNDSSIIGYTRDVVFSYNLEAQQMNILRSNGNCESKTYNAFNIQKLKDREDIILLSRLDYIYTEAGEYRRQYRISVLDLNTGEERILELE